MLLPFEVKIADDVDVNDIDNNEDEDEDKLLPICCWDNAATVTAFELMLLLALTAFALGDEDNVGGDKFIAGDKCWW